VISRTSAEQYRGSTASLKEIGAEVGAGYVLEGSVHLDRAGAGFNITQFSADVIAALGR